MRVNFEWLRDWVELDGDAERAAADLTTSGLEVESVERARATGDRGRRRRRRSRASRAIRTPTGYRFARSTTAAERLQVVCGAPNVAAGIKVPFARVGARLPGGKTIGAAELRGVKSHGMLCSAKELELPDDANGLLLLDADAPVGQTLTDYLRLDDAILEVNVTPNRGDCFSVLGLARELAARRDLPLARREPRPGADGPERALPGRAALPRALPALRGPRGPQRPHRPQVAARGSASGCAARGFRAIHPVVDVTNYVMLELGQPLHAYDLDKLSGKIDVRLASAG